MAIDKPLDAFKQQSIQDEPSLPKKLALKVAEFGIKVIFNGLAADILVGAMRNLLDPDSGRERFKEMFDLINAEFEHIETTKVSHDDMQKAIQLIFWYDRHERDNAKRARYVKLIGNALRSEEQIQDVTSFIKTIEQLNERDVTVLKVLNKVMNKAGDWKASPDLMSRELWKIHPNTFIQRAPELSTEVAMALGQKTETNLFSREEGYSICNRLQGFGLAHYIDTQARELPVTNYSFRPSVAGLTLLKLLGENVPNLEYYHQSK